MNTVFKVCIGVGTGLLFVCSAGAQSADALIDKLVDKGILTAKEADELRQETDKNFSQAYAAKTGMPEWVTSFKFYGDIRARYESFWSDGEVLSLASGTPELVDFTTRNRFRFRLRFGATITMLDNLEAGFRLTSSEQVGNFGGDPISGNSTMQNNASKKYVFIDLAYMRWYFPSMPTVSGNLTVGKMENPFVFEDLVFDPDYTPEGAAVQSAFKLSDTQTLRLIGGGFLLDEFADTSSDPYLLGVQVRHDASWTKKFRTSIGAAWLVIQNDTNLYTAAVPNQTTGNTRDAVGALVYNYRPWVFDGSGTYVLDKFPLYKGAFPIKVGGTYLYNPVAPNSADNWAWDVGVTLGKSGKRGTWDFSYTYKWQGANAWYEEVLESDFGALYRQPTLPPGPAAVTGYNPGSNIKGHIFKLAYSPTDSLTLSAKYYLTELIETYPAGVNSDMNRLEIDASLKF